MDLKCIFQPTQNHAYREKWNTLWVSEQFYFDSTIWLDGTKEKKQ